MVVANHALDIYRKGILGMNKLVKLFQDEWLDDIRNNQLASLLKGLGPMNTLIELRKFSVRRIRNRLFYRFFIKPNSFLSSRHFRSVLDAD